MATKPDPNLEPEPTATVASPGILASFPAYLSGFCKHLVNGYGWSTKIAWIFASGLIFFLGPLSRSLSSELAIRQALVESGM